MKATTTNSQIPKAADRLAELTDEELLLEYRQTGDRELFARLVKRYERELYSYLRRYLGDAEVAEDAFQAAFLQVHLKCKHYEEGRAVRPWLYTIATNQAIDAQRRNRRHRLVSLDRAAVHDGDDAGKLIDLLASHEASPQSHFSAMERQAWLAKAVETLPDGLKNVVNLVYFQELKYREAADILGIPVGTVKSRLHAAVARLNECWKQAQPDSL